MKNLLMALVICTLIFAVTDTQARQWYNQDGLTARQHAELVHHYSTAGMTDEQVIAENDHYHNMYGGYHNHVHNVSHSHVRTRVIPSPTIVTQYPIQANQEVVRFTYVSSVPSVTTILPRTQVPTLAPRIRSNLQSLRARLRAIRPLRSILCR